MASGKRPVGIGDNFTFRLQRSFFRSVTFGAKVTAASVFTDHSGDGHFPRHAERLQVLGYVSIWQLELICCVIVEISTQAAGFAPVVSGDRDSDVVDQIICDPQAKVGHNDII